MADHGSHARHDRFAIAAAIGGGPAPTTIGACPACGALYADLSVLRDAIRRAWTPVLVRDLRLSPADGARLRPRGWRAVLATIGSRRDVISRPLAIGFTTLGLVGVLMTSASILPMGSAAAPPSKADSGVTVAEAPEPPIASAAASSAPGAALPSTSPVREPASAPPTDASQVPPPTFRTSLPDRSSGTFLLSIGFLSFGVGLFGLRRSARRSAMR